MVFRRSLGSQWTSLLLIRCHPCVSVNLCTSCYTLPDRIRPLQESREQAGLHCAPTPTDSYGRTRVSKLYLGDRSWSQATDCKGSLDSTLSRSLPLMGCSSTRRAFLLTGTSITEKVSLASVLYLNVPVTDSMGTEIAVFESTQNSWGSFSREAFLAFTEKQTKKEVESSLSSFLPSVP